jgi:small subunit ribosomal protein S2
MTEVTNAIADGLAERKAEKQEAAPKEKVADAPKKAKAATKEEAPKAKEVEKVEKVAEVKEEAPKKPASSAKADDLTKIEGIGPKAAEAIVNAGIETYAKLADAKADKIKEIITEASSRMAHLDPTSWPKQAKMAADGKWDELKEWQDNTKGGVE